MHLTRRELAAALAGAAALPGAAAQDEKKPEKKPSPRDLAADALLEIVKARHGQHLTPAQLTRVRASILSGLRAAETLARVKLPPADEPALIFQADLP